MLASLNIMVRAFKKKLILVMIFMGLFFLVKGQVIVRTLSQQWTVAPGEIYRGVIEIKNTGSDPAAVKIYQSDYLFYADGRNEFPPPGTIPRSNAPWLKLDIPPDGLVTIPPEETYLLAYEIHVPDDPNLVGTYWSMIKVRPMASTPAPQGPLGMQQIVEYGIQIVTDIGDTGIRKIKLIGTKLVPREKDGGFLFQVDVENIGQRWLRPIAYLEVYDEQGSPVGRFQSRRGRLRIYPGCSVRYTIELPVLQPGTYPSILVIDNLDQYVWAAQIKINVKK